MGNHFFDEQLEQSLVKATIVAKYFLAWAKVIIPTVKKRRGDRVAYIDLFAGPGRYQDGSKSTPLLVLEQAISHPDLREMLVTQFNDLNTDSTRALEREIASLPGIERLKHKPLVYNNEVGEEIVKSFEAVRLVPTLFFVDPWGYKGLSLRLINSVLKDWGCDCIFFFNYNRISMGLPNDCVEDHMDALFGVERAGRLRQRLAPLNPFDRESVIVEELAQALQDKGGRYVLPFGFKNAAGNRTSHHLIFVSKHFRGYEMMRDIMAAESSSAAQGVASFAYNPVDRRCPLMYELTRPLDELEGRLVQTFAGRTLTMAKVYEQFNVGKPFIERNYKDALLNLELAGKVVADPPAANRPKRGGKPTFADGVRVTFPPVTVFASDAVRPVQRTVIS